MDINKILDDILRREGGYVDNPADKGGPTNFGITIGTLQGTGRFGDIDGDGDVDVMDVQLLPIEKAKQIYLDKYITPFDSWAAWTPLHEFLIDSGVQHGPARVLGWISELYTSDPDVLYKRLFARRMKFYGEIISARPANAQFAKGWFIRLAEFVR